ncbi:NAD(P)H-dependent oxidoreductase [Fodinibius salsisoli]|uniref:NAD(P)H-dependent oxidoreductase n=1 Tax=Fodinibius salsisoli TaxID=2820877 RepID=A0ABT3PI02_9BACT|nr:NAD(P)H-dependent oxidoreductase [Fodinibius salsisoli]MCW9705552.1 NAD(P)H-dependent oxidoreductase [Fodinibius salsisoli]
MENVFIINGGQKFAHAKGKFNRTITDVTASFFTEIEGCNVIVTHTDEPYDPEDEVDKFIDADIIIYHTPIYWFQLPHGLKKYFDVVFREGHYNGIWTNDGRSSKNPEINYGTGGLLTDKKYMLTTSWNAPKGAFTIPDEFFMQKGVDEGPMFGFHRMNAYLGMEKLESFHFHDIVKNGEMETFKKEYKIHLKHTFAAQHAAIS